MSRYFLNNVYYFITVPTIGHRDCFTTPEEKYFLLKKLLSVFKEFNIDKYDFSIMSDHYHFLAYFHEGREIPKILKKINGPSAMFIKKRRNLSNGVWDEYYLYIASTDELFDRIRGYVIGNPLKHGEVTNISELLRNPFSTFKEVAAEHGRSHAELLVSSVINVDEDQFFQLLTKNKSEIDANKFG